MAEKERMKNKGLIIGIAAMVVITALLPVVTGMLFTERYTERQAAFIGRIHEVLPGEEAEIAALLYEKEFTEEEKKQGEEVLVSLGYTDKGLSVLSGR